MSGVLPRREEEDANAGRCRSYGHSKELHNHGADAGAVSHRRPGRPALASRQPHRGDWGRPCIPGSSLKGALRAEIERALNIVFFDRNGGQWKDEAYRPCLPAYRISKEEERLVEEGRYRSRGCAYPGDSAICPCCYLLGAQGLVGFVNVPFLYAEPGYATLPGVRLDRVFGTVVDGSNRKYQTLPPETVFTGEMEVLIEDPFLGWRLGSPRPLKEKPDADAWLKGKTYEPDAVLQSYILDRLQGIKHLGGFRSRGCGRVSITVTEVT